MNPRASSLIIILTTSVVGIYFFFSLLIKGQPFFAPLSIAILLTLLMVPLSNKLESWGFSRGWASFVCTLILMGFFTGLFFIVSAQVKTAAEQWPEMKEKAKPKIEQLQKYIEEHTGISEAEQDKKMKESVPGGGSGEQQTSDGENQQSGDGNSGSQETGSGGESGGAGTSVLHSAAKAVWAFVGFLGTSLLTFVYIFFLLVYRAHFEKAILKFIPSEQKETGRKALRDIGQVTQNYLLGKLMLILFLAILYAIGLSISGVEHAILISILAAVLSLVPYVGNMVGLVLALALGTFSGGGSGAIVGIIATFTVAQFVESYILEPYIVGQRVDIHPVFTILAVIAGGEIWGIVGMVIAIPILGIVKAISDHVPVLAPVGFLLGEDQEKKSSGKSNNFFQKVKRKFTR